ncbi:hypothetical protein P7C70_g27, partial [Phenoliferia sp. Uapishka_3]
MDWEVADAVSAVRALRDAEEEGESLMAVDLPWEMWDGAAQAMGEGTEGLVVVLDTNILLRYLPLLRSLVDVLGDRPTRTLQFLVPHIVVQELDGLKSSTRMTTQSLITTHDESNPGSANNRQASIGTLSRAASKWLLQVLPSPGCPPTFVRGQRQFESLIPRVNGRRSGGTNDDEILDVARYFAGLAQRVVLLSDDKNLCVKAQFEHVRSVSLEDRLSPRNLLERLDSTLADQIYAPSGQVSPQKYSESSIGPPTPNARAARASPKRTRSRPPTSPSNSPTLPRPLDFPSIRTSARSSTFDDMSSMEIDYDQIHVPHFSPPPPPFERDVRAPADVVRNAGDVLTHLIALPLYLHVFRYLKEHSPETHQDWLGEIGDWRHWQGHDVISFMRRWWEEGGVKDVCSLGLDEALKPCPVAINPISPRPPVPKLANRATQTSRWSTQSSSPVPAPIFHPPLPAPPRLPHLSGITVASLRSNLPPLIAALEAATEEINKWSVPRFEIFLETCSAFFQATLGGLLKCGVANEVGEMMKDWAKYHEKAQSTFAKTGLAAIPTPGNNSFLSDLVTSEAAAPEKPITAGFYRQEAGPALVYTYDYEEIKIIVEGEFHISDQTGKKAVGLPGDVFYFHSGDTITFTSPTYGLGFFCGQKKFGHV